MKRLAAYGGLIFACLLLLELIVRTSPQRFADATYLSRFKASILAAQPPRDLLILGSSMLEEGLLPKVIDTQLGITTFNAATPNTSREIFQLMCERAAGHPGIKVALIELSEPQLRSQPLEWVSPKTPATTDAKIFAAIEAHSELARQRNALRFDSLLRLFSVLLFARTFDGSEHYGVDYIKAVFGRWQFTIPEHPPELIYRLRDAQGGATDTISQGAVDIFAECAARLRKRGAAVLLVIPPTRWAEPRRSYDAEVDAIASATGARVLDFNVARPGEIYFRDWQHLTHDGAVAFSLALAQALKELHAFQ